MSDDEIVEEYYKITGERITRQTVGNVLRRALKKMRKELEDMGVSEESVFG
jgi:Arc/MetJ family transcription regulator